MADSDAPAKKRNGWIAWLIVVVVVNAMVWVPWPVFVAAGGFALAYWRVVLNGLALCVGGIVVGTVAVKRKRREKQRLEADGEAQPVRPIAEWAIWFGMAGLIVIGVFVGWWLVTTFGGGFLPDPTKTVEQNRLKLEAIKIAGSVVVGTGGVAALLLAARRQRVTELDLNKKAEVAKNTKHDADERRATEIYTAAAEQLGSDKAAVRMAGMYALSRLGNAHKEHRQTIVNLLCAYLRMPELDIGEYEFSSESTSDKQADDRTHQPRDESAVVVDLAPAPLTALTALAPDLGTLKEQETQVRLTAQRLLAHHLRPKRDQYEKATNYAYWEGMELDLVGAHLHDWDFSGCEVQRAAFDGARFTGETTFFRKAHFEGDAGFAEAHFEGDVWFSEARFGGDTLFREVHFEGDAGFREAHFGDSAWFDKAHFGDSTGFDEAHFGGIAWFDEAHFGGDTWFHDAHFEGVAGFGEAHFEGSVWFREAHFGGNAGFDKARFGGDTLFHDAHFGCDTMFREANFAGNVLFDEANFAGDALFDEAWARLDVISPLKPPGSIGWTIHEADPGDECGGQWGIFVRVDPSESG